MRCARDRQPRGRIHSLDRLGNFVSFFLPPSRPGSGVAGALMSGSGAPSSGSPALALFVLARTSFDVFRGEFKPDELAPQLLGDGQGGCTAGEWVDDQFARI